MQVEMSVPGQFLGFGSVAQRVFLNLLEAAAFRKSPTWISLARDSISPTSDSSLESRRGSASSGTALGWSSWELSRFSFATMVWLWRRGDVFCGDLDVGCSNTRKASNPMLHWGQPDGTECKLRSNIPGEVSKTTVVIPNGIQIDQLPAASWERGARAPGGRARC